MTHLRHRMPFGAEVDTDGGVRFRLWAPAAEQVDLEFDDPSGKPHRAPMSHIGDGCHELRTDAAGAGSRYRFLISGPLARGAPPVPDPASRFQPDGVHAASEVIDPLAFDWRDGDWRGRDWEGAVIYELHLGCFSPPGTFAGAAERLEHLADLGVTAVELMPVAAFPGSRNWGYDGVLPFAPHAGYGRPEDMKTLVQTAHGLGLMVLLDVVYNHFGPEGNYLHLYAPQFFTERHQTPWGAGIDFDGPHSAMVRDYFVQNALYWLTEYRLDGLRLDAVHAIADDSERHILTEIAEAVQAGPGRERRIHLVLENDGNQARYLARRADGRPRWYDAQWNDDFHHAAHVLLTGERDGYYADYAKRPAARLARCLAEGFGYQGEPSAFRGGAPRGEPSVQLPPTAFVSLLQNHDQIGNRALGERLASLAAPQALRAATAVLLLAPSPPLLFMGQELGTRRPFLFFCDFGEDLAESVTEGRRREFAHFERFADPAARETIPDPNDPGTFDRSRLDWTELEDEVHRDWLRLHRDLLALRRREIVPRLAGTGGDAASYGPVGDAGLWVHWRLGDGSELTLLANLGDTELDAPEPARADPANPLHLEPAGAAAALENGRLPPWTAAWHLRPARDRDDG